MLMNTVLFVSINILSFQMSVLFSVNFWIKVVMRQQGRAMQEPSSPQDLG